MNKDDKLIRFLEGETRADDLTSQQVEACEAPLTVLAQSVAHSPGPALRGRLLASVSERERFSGFVPRAARMLDLSEPNTAALLGAFNAGELSLEQIAEGIHCAALSVGPGRSGCEASLIQLDPGASIPRHGHHGDEWGLVLQGHLTDDLGADALPGDYVRSDQSAVHRVWSRGHVPCLVINMVEGGLNWSPE